MLVVATIIAVATIATVTATAAVVGRSTVTASTSGISIITTAGGRGDSAGLARIPSIVADITVATANAIRRGIVPSRRSGTVRLISRASGGVVRSVR
jgi:hypothetical protein